MAIQLSKQSAMQRGLIRGGFQGTDWTTFRDKKKFCFMVVCTSLRFVLRPFLFCYPIPYHFPAARCASISERRHPAPAITMSSHLVRNGSTVIRSPHQLLPHDVKLEEEELPDYNSEDFSQSDWEMCSNLEIKFGDYLTLKVCTCRQETGVAAQSTNEVAVARHIRAADVEHPGERYLRLIIREFTIYGPGGEHRCLLYTPQEMTYTEFRNSQPDRMLDKALLQQTYQLILIGLDLLHQLSVVHTDISPNNIPLALAKSFGAGPSHSMPITDGTPVLCDFGGARIGERKHLGDVMPDFYRAPELILGMEWDCKIDIWSIGVMYGRYGIYLKAVAFFMPLKTRMLDDEQHLAEMVALMGPPPQSFLQRSEKCRKYWDDEGQWIAATPIPEQSLDTREWRLEAEKYKDILKPNTVKVAMK
ncbi:protein kinase [Histoplasma capsulatum var. duboisii H88]|uniref:Protein kinase n=1 Tax=Ajellomyces capsulatus (strain H88) TaxID=544711 RepID=F0UDD0_AJEC8|nr:protein kinase [Histoplasma capsulatum var. duboisii H88]